MRAPIRVRFGAVSVPIYHFGDGRWAIMYRQGKGAKRKVVSCRTEQAAREKAEQICQEIAQGRALLGRLLTNDQLLQASAALQILGPLRLTLDGVARDVQAAQRMVGDASIRELASFWSKHHPFGREAEAA